MIYLLLACVGTVESTRQKDSTPIIEPYKESEAWWIAGCDGVYCPHVDYSEYDQEENMVHCQWNCATYKGIEHARLEIFFRPNECNCWELNIAFIFADGCTE